MKLFSKVRGWFFRLRVRLIIFITIFIGAVSLFIFIYFPAKFEEQSIIALNKRADIAASNIAVSASLGFSKDSSILDKAFKETLQTNELNYLVITDTAGELYNSYNFNAAEMNNYLSTATVEEITPDQMVLRKFSPIVLNDKTIGHVYLGFSLNSLRNDVRTMRISIGLISLIIFIISVFVIYLISSVITKPINSMIKDAEKIARGELSHRAKYKGTDEFGMLAKSFNYMAVNIEKSNTQIENLNRQLKNVFREKIGELNLEINQRRLAEFSLRQSEEQFRLLFELAPIGMVIVSASGRIQKVNQSFCTTLKYLEEELLSKSYTDLTFPDDQKIDIQKYDEIMNGDQSLNYFEKRFVRKDNEIIDAIVESFVIKNNNNEPVQFIHQMLDITERKKVLNELVAAKEKAEESDRLKSAFLAQMSHEIRTPLNIILNAIPLISDEINIAIQSAGLLSDKAGKTAEDENDPLLEAVNSAGKRLLRTIDLILNMSSVQTGNYEPKFEVIDLENELRKMIKEFQPMSNEKKIGLFLKNKERDTKITADRYTLVQIFENLIGNAIKYTIKGNVDVIISRSEAGKIKVDVKDTGIGISKEYLQNLFTPFSQENVGHKREFEGNGLGLALVKKYVEINKLDINVESEKDKGSTFTVVF